MGGRKFMKCLYVNKALEVVILGFQSLSYGIAQSLSYGRAKCFKTLFTKIVTMEITNFS